jgi:hypothetical protein
MATTDELLQYRNSIRDQMSQAKSPVTSDEAVRYLNQSIGNFEPLQNERRAIMAQAGNVLPTQLGEYFQNKQAGQSGASAMNQLQSIIGNQNNLRSTADLLGDQLQTGRGSISNIANSTLQMLGQKQSQLSDLLNLAQSDYQTGLQRDEAEKARSEARRAAAAQQAAMYGAYGQQSGGSYSPEQAGGSFTIADAPTGGYSIKDVPKTLDTLGNNTGNFLVNAMPDKGMGLRNLLAPFVKNVDEFGRKYLGTK